MAGLRESCAVPMGGEGALPGDGQLSVKERDRVPTPFLSPRSAPRSGPGVGLLPARDARPLVPDPASGLPLPARCPARQPTSWGHPAGLPSSSSSSVRCQKNSRSAFSGPRSDFLAELKLSSPRGPGPTAWLGAGSKLRTCPGRGGWEGAPGEPVTSPPESPPGRRSRPESPWLRGKAGCVPGPRGASAPADRGGSRVASTSEVLWLPTTPT